MYEVLAPMATELDPASICHGKEQSWSMLNCCRKPIGRRPRPGDGFHAYFAGKEHFILAAALACTSCTAAILLYGMDSQAFLYFGDAVSHVVRARQFVDS
jgi:hypothetical protein